MSESVSQVVVRGGTVVNDSWSAPADLLIRDGVIAEILQPDTGRQFPASTQIIDATDCLVMPGGVDPHCHVGYASGPYTSLDGYLECTRAAVFGGTTTIVDFAIPRPGERPIDVARHQRSVASGGLCDSALHGSVVEWDDTTQAQLVTLVNEGIVTFKMFTTYRHETMASYDTILRTMRCLRDVGGMTVVHCEDNSIIEEDQRLAELAGAISAAGMGETRSEIAETAAVAEVIALAEALRASVYLVHQSTPAAVKLSADARRRGVKVYTEAVAHHLLLDESKYAGPEPERWVCCPPLRSAASVTGLGDLLVNGEVTTVASDHCCYDLEQKRRRPDDVREMPNGLPGVETRLPATFSKFVATGRISPSDFVRLTSANPARTNGIYPRKGALMPGSDADIVIWDPLVKWTLSIDSLHMATDYTPFEGFEATGRPRQVLVRGRTIVEDGSLVTEVPGGRHIRAQKNPGL